MVDRLPSTRSTSDLHTPKDIRHLILLTERKRTSTRPIRRSPRTEENTVDTDELPPPPAQLAQQDLLNP